MYRLGRQTHKHRRGYRVILTTLAILFFAAVVYWLMHLRIVPEQNIRNAAPVSENYKTSASEKVAIDKPLFRLELPKGWREVETDKASSTAPKFSFSSPGSQAQMLDLYIDNPPTGMAVNRAIVVSSQGDGLTYDTVSDNCTTFTEASLKNPQSGNAPARWQTTQFICDMANTARAVVGTMSAEGINQVSVTGPTTGTHKLFITYIDNNINPNYGTFYDILRSLHFK